MYNLQKLFLMVLSLALISQVTAQTERDRGLSVQKGSAITAPVQQKKLALVIGNGSYQFATKLNNPISDANDMTETLKGLGFQVISGTNQTLPQMRKMVRDFGSQLKSNGGVGLFYYAGHGVQVGGSNYLVPVEANIVSEIETQDVALDLNSVLRQMDAAGNGLNVVVLDACRNNPFARSWNRSAGSGGLAQISAPTGTFIAYATAPDRTAADGTGRNGLYTSVLLEQIKRPNTDLLRLFQNVRTEVKARSKGQQIPFDSNSTTGEFYFIRANDANAATTTTAKSAQTSRRAKWETLLNKSENAPTVIREATKDLQENPDNIEALRMRSSAYRLKNDVEKQKADVTRLLPLLTNPTTAEEYESRCYANRVIEKNSEAVADCTKAISLKPKFVWAYYNRGLSYEDLDDYKSAITDFDVAIQLNPQFASAYNGRGSSHHNNGKRVEAIADYTKAISLDPKFATAYQNRSRSYFNEGKKELSEADEKKADELLKVK
ncbi:MAG: caspase family protein [Pyrinomonadaceae bacterium]|nr:caspase family protein [Pyrinomonadaceae bacterium]